MAKEGRRETSDCCNSPAHAGYKVFGRSPPQLNFPYTFNSTTGNTQQTLLLSQPSLLGWKEEDFIRAYVTSCRTHCTHRKRSAGLGPCRERGVIYAPCNNGGLLLNVAENRSGFVSSQRCIRLITSNHQWLQLLPPENNQAVIGLHI